MGKDMAKSHKELVRTLLDRVDERLAGELSTSEMTDLAIILVNLDDEEEEEEKDKIIAGRHLI